MKPSDVEKLFNSLIKEFDLDNLLIADAERREVDFVFGEFLQREEIQKFVFEFSDDIAKSLKYKGDFTICIETCDKKLCFVSRREVPGKIFVFSSIRQISIIGLVYNLIEIFRSF